MINKMNKTYQFHVHGMHCASCEMIIEDKLKEDKRVTSVKSDAKTKQAEVSGDFGVSNQETVMKELNDRLAPDGYSLSFEAERKPVAWREFLFAVPIAIGVVAIFFGLQSLGIVNMVNAEKMNYGTAFLIGIVASLSTCMAVVGGLVLSLSASFENKVIRPQILFHAGRLIGFFLLGGIMGAAGSAFRIGANGIFALSFLAGIVMLFLGVRLLDVLPHGKLSILKKPKRISRMASDMMKVNHSFAPALVGAATFFLPCGFTQSMQIYALSTGHFFSGSLTMLSFALGTLPILALLSFSSFAFSGMKKSGIFFKTVGIIVVLLALFNITNSFVSIGWIDPVFNF